MSFRKTASKALILLAMVLSHVSYSSNVSEWDTSAASNNAAPPNGFPEGQAPSTLNDAARELMAAVARWYEDLQGGLETTGTSNAYVLTTNSAHATLADQSLLAFRADRANTGAATLNVDGLGAKSLQSGGANIASGEIIADSVYLVAYNATNDAYDIVNTFSAAQISTNLGLGSLATQSTVNNGDWSGTDLAVANGGTGASDASTARTNLGLGTLATLSTINNGNWSGTDLALTNGGTGASDAGTARGNLGLVIGSDVQAYDADLATIAGLADTDSNFIVGNGSAWTVESGATARASLGLGSLATASTISGSNWSGTDLALTDGGTGSSTASGARTNLGLGTLATLSTINNGNWSGTDLALTNGGTGSSTASGARTNLGLGTVATLSSINNGNWSGTDLALTNGGTGASDAATARSNLDVPADGDVVHDTGNETIAGVKTFSSTPVGPDGGGFLNHANTNNNSGTITITSSAPGSTAGSDSGDIWLVY